MDMESSQRLANLIAEKNALEADIAALVGRPALIGHVGEFIAAQVFDIHLNESASQRSIDGYFNTGPLARKSVNVKWYPKRENLLDLDPDSPPDYYLVMTGPYAPAASSRNTTRPWLITSVYLFESEGLIDALRRRGVKIGVATSVAGHLWEEAEIYPARRYQGLVLSDRQRTSLAVFGSHDESNDSIMGNTTSHRCKNL